MNTLRTQNTIGASASPGKAWLRALERTARIAVSPRRVLPVVVSELAITQGNAPALISERERFTYKELSNRVNQYARWALDHDIAKGDTVALMMPNRPEYLAAWLGITSVGGVVALLNTNLRGPSLAHCINAVAPKHSIIAAGLTSAFETALPFLSSVSNVWSHGRADALPMRIDNELGRYSEDPLSAIELRRVTVDDLALLIFTSGTTGLPKAARVSHARVMQWSHWFAGMMDVQASDRMYDCLPMYHSVGGVMVPGAVLAGGGSVYIREKFSAGQFWSDVVRWDCTLIQYIGELCRYLLQSFSDCPPHNIRMACGNGLARDIWGDFQSQFRIPRILEFYASTEGGVSLFNIEGEPGALGRVPSYLTHRFSPVLVQFDFVTEQPIRNDQGLCIPCAPEETGEALGPVVDDPSSVGSRFEGYSSPLDSEKKLLHNVLKPGDCWVRTGDLIRRDKRGFFYFVDRVGDTFRWKGENVSTCEVAVAIHAFPGIRHANVYGVPVASADGRAGMAALVMEPDLDFPELRRYLATNLPRYARPLFLRIMQEIDLTGTFKISKTALIRQGYNPTASPDVIYFDHPERNAYVRLDESLYCAIQSGQVRL